MCLAIPARITEKKDDFLAEVDILGVKREIALDLTPQAQLGDYVLIHAGFAIEIVDEQYAQETLDLIRQFPELADVDIPETVAAPIDQAATASIDQAATAPIDVSAAGPKTV